MVMTVLQPQLRVGGNVYSVSGGKGGKYENDDTYIQNSGGYGGGIKTTNFSSSARYNNWTNIDFGTGGGNGEVKEISCRMVLVAEMAVYHMI